MTYGFLTVALLVLSFMLASGKAANATPFWASANHRPWWYGTSTLFAFCAYALYGFQAIPHAIEERSTKIPLHSISRILVISIGAAASAAPYGRILSVALLCATAVSLLKAWNGIFMMAVRLIVAMARVDLFPRSLARLHTNRKIPIVAILSIAILNILGIFLGRGVVVPITEMCSMVLTLTYVMCCVTILILRRRAARGGQAAVGGTALVWIGLIGASIMSGVAFASPFLRNGFVFPLEFQLLLGWLLVGTLR